MLPQVSVVGVCEGYESQFTGCYAGFAALIEALSGRFMRRKSVRSSL